MIDTKKIVAGDVYAMLGLVENQLATLTDTDVHWGSLREDGALIRGERPVIALLLGSQTPREGFVNAYGLGFTVEVYCRTAQTMSGALETALTAKLSDATLEVRKKVEGLKHAQNAPGEDYWEGVGYVESVEWVTTTYSENFYGIDERSRYPYAFSASEFLLLTEGLPVVTEW